MIDYDELRRLANKATTGGWSNSYGYITSDCGEMEIYDEGGHSIDDAKYIAAANPSVMIEILGERTALINEIDLLQKLLADSEEARHFNTRMCIDFQSKLLICHRIIEDFKIDLSKATKC